jgi:transposase-like protein
MINYIAYWQRFVTEGLCVDYLEDIRWAGRPVCPFCASGRVYICSSRRIFKCASCTRQFTVRTGTIFENSRVPLQKWFLAVYLLTTHDRISSSIQIGKKLDITQKSAWRMLTLIRSVVDDTQKEDDGKINRHPRGVDATFDEALVRIALATEKRAVSPV